MSKGAINQRLKFLVENLSTSVRAFSEAIGDSSSNTNNYIGSRQTEPKPEYLAKVINHFSNVNAHWLLSGNGDPFIGEIPQVTNTTTTRIKKVTGGAVHSGTGNQLITLEACQQELELTKRNVADLQKENEFLRTQLQMQDTIIKGKDELLEVLRGGAGRPH